MRPARVPQQHSRKAWVVENGVDAFVGEARLERGDVVSRIAGQESRRELRVVPRQAMTCIGENHSLLQGPFRPTPASPVPCRPGAWEKSSIRSDRTET